VVGGPGRVSLDMALGEVVEAVEDEDWRGRVAHAARQRQGTEPKGTTI
jgi:hypothetical protein